MQLLPFPDLPAPPLYCLLMALSWGKVQVDSGAKLCLKILQMAKCSQDIIQRWTDLLLVEKGDIYILHSNPLQLDHITRIIKTFPAFGNLSENQPFYKNAVLQLVKKAGSAVLRADHVPNLEERQVTRQWTVDQLCSRCTKCGIVAPSKKVHTTDSKLARARETSEERYELCVSRTSDRELGKIVRLPLATSLSQHGPPTSSI